LPDPPGMVRIIAMHALTPTPLMRDMQPCDINGLQACVSVMRHSR
jgi:hypothetical protein